MFALTFIQPFSPPDTNYITTTRGESKSICTFALSIKQTRCHNQLSPIWESPHYFTIDDLLSHFFTTICQTLCLRLIESCMTTRSPQMCMADWSSHCSIHTYTRDSIQDPIQQRRPCVVLLCTPVLARFLVQVQTLLRVKATRVKLSGINSFLYKPCRRCLDREEVGRSSREHSYRHYVRTYVHVYVLLLICTAYTSILIPST